MQYANYFLYGYKCDLKYFETKKQVRQYFATQYNMEVHIVANEHYWIARIRDREPQFEDAQIIHINSNVISDSEIQWQDIIYIFNLERVVKPRSGNRKKIENELP